jgi:hypothetical protein
MASDIDAEEQMIVFICDKATTTMGWSMVQHGTNTLNIHLERNKKKSSDRDVKFQQEKGTLKL